MHLRRLNDLGLQRLDEELGRIRSGESKTLSTDLESSDRLSAAAAPPLEIERLSFPNRFAMAEYFYRRFEKVGLADVEGDVGLWAWLSVFLFEQLCPPDGEGKRHPGETARWIPDPSNFKKYYRHLLAGPFRVYRLHVDDPRRAMVVLSGQLSKPGELNEQLASRQELITNKAVIDVASRLYVDARTSLPRSGAAGRGPGSVRRFAMVLRQYDVTWDINLMTSLEILSMLPAEFARFRA
jgi:hypothetical protein